MQLLFGRIYYFEKYMVTLYYFRSILLIVYQAPYFLYFLYFPLLAVYCFLLCFRLLWSYYDIIQHEKCSSAYDKSENCVLYFVFFVFSFVENLLLFKILVVYS